MANDHRRRHHHHASMLEIPPHHRPKPDAKLLSLILKAIIMSLLTSLFFLFLSIAVFVLLHLCFAGRTFHRSSRRHQSHFPGEPNSGYSPEELHKLPRFRYGTELELKPVLMGECVVCLDSFQDGDSCRRLPGCNHVFHSNCIDKWLIKVPACPICRACVRINTGSIGSAIGVEEGKQLWAVRV